MTSQISINEALKKGIAAQKAGFIRDADQYYTAILDKIPTHPDANHNMGILALTVGKADTAISFLKVALESNPDIERYWLSYINALVKLERFGEAKKAYSLAKEKYPNSAGINKLGKHLAEVENINQQSSSNKTLEIKNLQDLCKKGEFQKTLLMANKLLSDFPDSEVLFNICGVCNAGLKQHRKALDSYQKAIAIKPDFVGAYYNMGNSYGELKEFEKAIEAYKNALALDPNFADALNNIGNAYNKISRYAEAVTAFENAISLKPNLFASYYNLGNALKKMGELNRAIEAYKRAVSINPELHSAYYNMGNLYNELNKFDEAVEAYKKAVSINPKEINYFNNMGNAYLDLRKFREALEAYKKATSLNSNNPDAFNNMGNAYQKLGKHKEAIEAYKKAISKKPDFADAFNNMGNAYSKLGEYENAISALTKSIAINPDEATAYNNLGTVYQKNQKFFEAMEAFSKSLSINSDFTEAYYNIGVMLTNVTLTKPFVGLDDIIVSLLDRETLIRPKSIMPAAISILKFDPIIKRVMTQHANGQLYQHLDEIIFNLSNSKLLMKIMSLCPITDLELEAVLIDIRSAIISSFSALTLSPELLRLQSALALQCFINEYIYLENEADILALKKLETSVEEVLSKKNQPNPHAILCLASQKALYQFKWINAIKITDELKEVFTMQVIEPRQELELKSSIPVLEEICDETSSKVRDQYEDSPYPRWVRLGFLLVSELISELFEEYELKLYNSSIADVESPSILVAGCGTGQHSITTAVRFKNATVLAVDLSLSSLAYAKRKSAELGIKNIEYMHADILDLAKLEKKFDIIESVGVLHHMEDPLYGWRALRDCLKPNGLMLIGLYSKLARQHIAKFRKEGDRTAAKKNEYELKYIRNNIKNSQEQYCKALTLSSDFFSTSSLRDLLFHVQETTFTIPQIKNNLEELGLAFCGFEDRKLVQHFKSHNNDVSNQYDLNIWETYETRYPNAFAGMYQFWCQLKA